MHEVDEVNMVASMGPLFFRAENVGTIGDRAHPTQLQWGRSFSERRTVPPTPAARNGPGFNGAALFQSGEPRPALRAAHPPRASMGPLFFRAENDR